MVHVFFIYIRSHHAQIPSKILNPNIPDMVRVTEITFFPIMMCTFTKALTHICVMFCYEQCINLVSSAEVCVQVVR